MAESMDRHRRRVWLGALGMVAWAAAEVAVVVLVAKAISWWTVVALAATSFIGLWVLAHEGSRSLGRLRESIATGIRAPEQAGSTALAVLGGLLLLLPGFVSDVAGVLLALPPTQAPIRKFLGRRLDSARSRIDAAHPDSVVIEGEVVSEPTKTTDGPLVIEGTVIDDEARGQ